MSSIITITLNPAIDKSTTIAELVPDKKMKCSNPVFEPGGGGVNVARALHQLGGNAKAIYLAGGYSGKFFTELLNSENIESSVIEIVNHTRENLIILNKKNNRQYRFGMPGPTINEPEWKQLLMEIKKVEDISYIIASGTVPAGVPVDIFARISTIAREKNAKFIVDTSGEPLKEALNAGVYLIKPNLGELSALVGKEWIDNNQVEMMAKQIIRENKCEVVVVSMGEAGALLVTANEKAKITPPVVEKKYCWCRR